MRRIAARFSLPGATRFEGEACHVNINTPISNEKSASRARRSQHFRLVPGTTGVEVAQSAEKLPGKLERANQQTKYGLVLANY
jgi:hypothetical protein